MGVGLAAQEKSLSSNRKMTTGFIEKIMLKGPAVSIRSIFLEALDLLCTKPFENAHNKKIRSNDF
jgi:hypothetical protein